MNREGGGGYECRQEGERRSIFCGIPKHIHTRITHQKKEQLRDGWEWGKKRGGIRTREGVTIGGTILVINLEAWSCETNSLILGGPQTPRSTTFFCPPLWIGCFYFLFFLKCLSMPNSTSLPPIFMPHFIIILWTIFPSSMHACMHAWNALEFPTYISRKMLIMFGYMEKI